MSRPISNQQPQTNGISASPNSASSNGQYHSLHHIDRIANFYGDDPDYNPYEDVTLSGQNASATTVAPSSTSSGGGAIKRRTAAANKSDSDIPQNESNGQLSVETDIGTEEENVNTTGSDFANRKRQMRPESIQIDVTPAEPTIMLQGYGLVPEGNNGLYVSINQNNNASTANNTSALGSTLSALSMAANWGGGASVAGIKANTSTTTPTLSQYQGGASQMPTTPQHQMQGGSAPQTAPISPQQLSTPHASIGNDSFANYDGVNSVSVAGSTANSADLGGFADLDAFGQYQHNPYLRAASGGNLNSSPPAQYQEGHSLNPQMQQLNNAQFNPHYNNNPQNRSYTQATQQQRRGVPNFEQTDRYVAEFYYYQDQQEEALLYYNQQRDLNQQMQMQQASQQRQHSTHVTSAASSHHAPRPVAMSSTGESSDTPHHEESEDPSTTTPSEKDNTSYPFAGDVLSVLPTQLSVDLSVKKKAKQNHNNNSQHPPGQQHPSRSANNDNDDANGPAESNSSAQEVAKDTKSAPTKSRSGPPKTGPLNPLQAMRGFIGPAVIHKETSRKGKRPTRFMPPPPPSLQAARVMAVCHPTKGGGAEYYEGPREAAIAALVAAQAELHGADGKTCIAEGDFAFLTKAGGTSDWARGGYGATYSATVAEGAPAATYRRLDPSGDGFQNYLQVLMQWYSRVARLFGHNDPQCATAFDHLVGATAAPRSHLKPTVLLPERFFSQASIPPCPRPELSFEVSPDESSGLLKIDKLDQFVAWHDAIHGWWERHVQPRTVGHQLHLQLMGATEETNAENGSKKVNNNFAQRGGRGGGGRGRGGRSQGNFIASNNRHQGHTGSAATPHNMSAHMAGLQAFASPQFSYAYAPPPGYNGMPSAGGVNPYAYPTTASAPGVPPYAATPYAFVGGNIFSPAAPFGHPSAYGYGLQPQASADNPTANVRSAPPYLSPVANYRAAKSSQ